MLTTSINIKLDSDKGGQWYARENKTQKGVTVTFFQRDGKQTFLQKFKDLINVARSGTELASKYSKELGLPKDAFSNPKNEYTKESISNNQLNQIFGSTYRRLEEKISFYTTDLLVSHFDRAQNKQVDIMVNKSKIIGVVSEEKNYEIQKEVKIHNLKTNLYRINQADTDFTSHLSLAFDIRDKPNFSANKDEMEAAKKALIDIKKVPLRLGDYQTEIQQKKEFDLTINDLLKPLEVKFFLNAIHNHKLPQSQIDLPTRAIEVAVDIREISPNRVKAEEAIEAYQDLVKFKTESEGQPWFKEISSRLDSLISISLRKVTINSLFETMKNLNIERTERNSILDSIYRAISIRENLPNRLSIESKQSDYEKLNNFKNTYSGQAGFNVISEQVDELINVLENNLLSLNQTAQT
jgi:hypothetical protein